MFPEFEKYSLYPESKGTITSANTLPMEKQTAVEWLFLMLNNPNKDQEFANKLFEQAKQMEKEQIKAAYERAIVNYGVPPLEIKQ